MNHQAQITKRRPTKLDIRIDNLETMIHILSNLPEEYQTIMEILDNKLDDK